MKNIVGYDEYDIEMEHKTEATIREILSCCQTYDEGRTWYSVTKLEK